MRGDEFDSPVSPVSASIPVPDPERLAGIDMVPEIPMAFTEEGNPGINAPDALDEQRKRTRDIIMSGADILASCALYSVAEPNWDRLFEEFRLATMPAIGEFRRRMVTQPAAPALPTYLL